MSSCLVKQLLNFGVLYLLAGCGCYSLPRVFDDFYGQ